jgi:hypothetical protein
VQNDLGVCLGRVSRTTVTSLTSCSVYWRINATCDRNTVAAGYVRKRLADEGILLQKKKKTMDKRKQPTQQQLSFPNFYTSLRRRVQSQNTKVHWNIPFPRSCQDPSFSILSSSHQASFPSASCKTFGTLFHRQRFHLYPHTLPHPRATTWLADVQRQGAMIRSWIFHRADFYTEERVAISQRHHDQDPETIDKDEKHEYGRI